jgi:quinol monooxygenase YgiN
MYASIRSYRVDAERVDELMHRIDRDFAESMAAEPGFLAYQAIDTGNGTISTISVFREHEQAEASNELAAQWIEEELGDFNVQRMGVRGGEVMVSRASSPMLNPAHH